MKNTFYFIRKIVIRCGFFAASAMLVFPLSSYASEVYPDHAISMIVPYPPGGPTDVFARILADGLSKELGQTVFVENRGGAAGNIGVGFAARARNDGYTVVFATAAIAIAPAVYKSLSYDVVKDFEPVAFVGSTPPLVLVAPDGPGTIKQLIDLLKANPGKYNYAISGYGSATHIVNAYFNVKAGVQALAIPYKGAAPANQGMMAKSALYTFETASSAISMVKSGTLKAIAIASDQRSSVLPTVPTVAEAGVAGIDGSTWNMVLAPAKTSEARVAKLNVAINKVLSNPAIVKRLESLAVDVTSDSTPKSSDAFLKSELKRWAELVAITGVTMQ